MRRWTWHPRLKTQVAGPVSTLSSINSAASTSGKSSHIFFFTHTRQEKKKICSPDRRHRCQAPIKSHLRPVKSLILWIHRRLRFSVLPRTNIFKLEADLAYPPPFLRSTIPFLSSRKDHLNSDTVEVEPRVSYHILWRYRQRTIKSQFLHRVESKWVPCPCCHVSGEGRMERSAQTRLGRQMTGESPQDIDVLRNGSAQNHTPT